MFLFWELAGAIPESVNPEPEDLVEHDLCAIYNRGHKPQDE